MIRVILCSCNGEKYIRQQIDSIFAQNVPDIKLRVCDDASSDGTEEILKEYRMNDPQHFGYYVRKTPSGSACRSFLTAILEESGADHYLLCDQDDVWHPDKVAKLKHRMEQMEEKHGKNVPLLVHSDAAVVDEDLSVISPSFAEYAGLDPQTVTFAAELIQNRFTGGSMMFNESLRTLVRSVPEHAIMHDHWLGLIALSLGYVGYVDEALYDYRQHENNQVGASEDNILKKISGRLDPEGESRKAASVNYAKKKLQAEEFASLYDDLLAPEHKETLKAFLSLRESDRVTRLKLVRQYGFTCSRWHQTAESILL